MGDTKANFVIRDISSTSIYIYSSLGTGYFSTYRIVRIISP